MKIFLIGFMGAGKTYWGKQWAQHFNYTFIDLDDEIEKSEGQQIVSIFEEKGEDYFRKIEAEVLRKVINSDNTIIACGGGTPCYADNMQWMNDNGNTVYLCKTPAELYSNVAKQKDQRPLLKSLDDQEIISFIEQKLQEREMFYEQAQNVLKNNQTTIHSLDKLIKYA
jgi:shikimate kinase